MVLPIETLTRRIQAETNDPKKVAGATKLRNLARKLYKKGELDLDVPDHIFPEPLQQLPIYHHPLFDYDPNTRSLAFGDEAEDISRRVAQLLEIFIVNANITVPRGRLFDHLTEYQDSEKDINLVDFYVARLRKHILHGRNIDPPIKTVRGMGYQFTGPKAEDFLNNGKSKDPPAASQSERKPPTWKQAPSGFKTEAQDGTEFTVYQAESNIYTNGVASIESQKPSLWGEELKQPVYKHPLFTYRPVDSVLIVGGEIIELTKTENRLLYLLAKSTDSPVERDTIIDLFRSINIHQTDDGNFMAVNMRRLRIKIDAGRNIDPPIRTVRSVGYVLLSEDSNTF